MHIYQMSAKLLGDTMGKMNENLTSVVLAASVFTLTLGYISKLLLKQSTDVDVVSVLRRKTVTVIEALVSSHCYFFIVIYLCLSGQKHPPYIPSSIPFLGHAIAFGKSPIEFLENAYNKVSVLKNEPATVFNQKK